MPRAKRKKEKSEVQYWKILDPSFLTTSFFLITYQTFIIALVLRGVFSFTNKESISTRQRFNSFRLATKSRGENFLLFITLLPPLGNRIVDYTF